MFYLPQLLLLLKEPAIEPLTQAMLADHRNFVSGLIPDLEAARKQANQFRFKERDLSAFDLPEKMLWQRGSISVDRITARYLQQSIARLCPTQCSHLRLQLERQHQKLAYAQRGSAVFAIQIIEQIHKQVTAFDEQVSTELLDGYNDDVEPDTAAHHQRLARRARVAARVLKNELAQRIIREQSVLRLVRRYATRCEVYEAVRLRALAEKWQGNARGSEDALVVDFGRYLFDAGLSPIFEAQIGKIRPDVIGKGFYIEAKQYKDAPSVKDLSSWFAQASTSWAKASKQYDCHSGFLVVFRRAGRSIEFPDSIQTNLGPLFLVCIDISEEQGSNEKSLHKFSKSELETLWNAAGKVDLESVTSVNE